MRSIVCAGIMLACLPASLHAVSFVRTCPLCPCPIPPPGCTCTSSQYCPPTTARAGFDTDGDIEPGDDILNISFTVQVAAGSGLSIYLAPPGGPGSLLPPASLPPGPDADVRTFISSYSCYPNDPTPPGACPLTMSGQTVATSGFVTVQWSPAEPLPGPGVYTLFRVAFEQAPDLGLLTLQSTQHLVATVSGQVVFQNSGAVPFNYAVFRQPSNYCPCEADPNWDGYRDGRDIAYFMDCLLGGEAGCACADSNGDGVVSTADIEEFVDKLMSGDDCF